MPIIYSTFSLLSDEVTIVCGVVCESVGKIVKKKVKLGKKGLTILVKSNFYIDFISFAVLRLVTFLFTILFSLTTHYVLQFIEIQFDKRDKRELLGNV